ncbi:glucose/galactose MFS transporter [Mucilaginibacter conchicola]|uniref:Glucose/galactose MFS transporter n=1 Tax=Mucilaginibacter conchicola TaxID=2303333 RepID=A0A372NPX6_9SPHI|nr:sugar MFS transporter [Mucilaginibacter conchicola]RFZ90986.1 glucose/galactose MFS transporter [Mucilaginibacter conchicola]
MTNTKPNNIIPLAIICVVFFVFGFATWVNAVLIPYFKLACELSNFQSYLVAFAFYISYLVISVPAAYLLKKIGFKKGMMIGFWIMAAGAAVFVPAAMSRSYYLFLAGLFTIGTGLALLQTAANPYVTILGAQERAAQRISIMGICNKTAGIIAPLILAVFIIKPGDSELMKAIPNMDLAHKEQVLNELIQRVIVPYSVVAVVLTLLGILIRFSPLPDIEEPAGDDIEEGREQTKLTHFPHLMLGAVAIFFHVGSQVIAIDSIIPYAQSMGLSLPEAKVFPSYILFTTICGYLLGISLIPKVISQRTALRICTVLGLVFSMLILSTKGWVTFIGHRTDVSIWFMVMLGFANSMIWAGIWPLALNNLGKYLKLGASLLIMGLCGNAILPLIYGHFADQLGLREAYWVLLPCYLYLIFYAFRGHKVKRWSLYKRNYHGTI